MMPTSDLPVRNVFCMAGRAHVPCRWRSPTRTEPTAMTCMLSPDLLRPGRFGGRRLDADGRAGRVVYALTGSPFYIGLVALARAPPVFVFSLVGGTIADR